MSTIRHALDAGHIGLSATPNFDPENSNVKTTVPDKYSGYVMKKKKWPMKGWHKRYFILENGFLKYGKTPQSIVKHKIHGMMDIGCSVMSTKKNSRTIDLDAEDTILHLKIKSSEVYHTWVSHLRQHREFRQVDLKRDSTLTNSNTTDTFQSPTTPIDEDKHTSKKGDNVFETCSQELQQVQIDINLLFDILRKLQLDSTAQLLALSIPPPSPSLSKKDKKHNKKSMKKQTKTVASLSSSSSSAISSSTIVPGNFKVPEPLESSHALSHSNPDISIVSASSAFPGCNVDDEWNNIKPNKTQIVKSQQSTPTHPRPPRAATFSASSTSENVYTKVGQLTDKHEQFLSTASKVHHLLSSVLEVLVNKEDAMQKSSTFSLLKHNIQQANLENQDLRSRLQRIHQDSFIPVQTLCNHGANKRKLLINNPLLSQLSSESQLSIYESTSEMFYDAEEYLLSDEDGSTDSDESNIGDDEVSSEAELSESESISTQSLPYEVEEIQPSLLDSTRRSKLPCPRPNTDVSLWNILKKNIGKDLSKVAMPVTLNEPLNTLQLLCEEIEYSELLEKADNSPDQFERMLLVAAFAVSAYSSTYYRAGQKPFNPILGETYECIREDKGFRFIAEQVCHHPPISVCHAHGDNFQYWQDSRFKNKFWGKSMEIFPVGSVHVLLKKSVEQYSWKKVTSCVHNIMSGTRWIEHYGDMNITCGSVTCRLTFNKSGYWNNKNGEISGVVLDADGEVKHRLHGKWYEGVYSGVGNSSKCIWRPGSMPPDFDKYYGFTRFAVELNELELKEALLLPRTDTRFRPDQRCLEEGNIHLAEEEKQRVEQLQRNQKKERDINDIPYQPLFFKKSSNGSEETWLFTDTYWKLREEPGFANFDQLPLLW